MNMAISETTFTKVERKVNYDTKTLKDYPSDEFETEADRRGYIIWDKDKGDEDIYRTAELLASAEADKEPIKEDLYKFSDEELLAEMVRRVDMKPKTKKKVAKVAPMEPLPPISTNVIDFSEILEMTRRNEPIYTEISDEEIA